MVASNNIANPHLSRKQCTHLRSPAPINLPPQYRLVYCHSNKSMSQGRKHQTQSHRRIAPSLNFMFNKPRNILTNREMPSLLLSFSGKIGKISGNTATKQWFTSQGAVPLNHLKPTNHKDYSVSIRSCMRVYLRFLLIDLTICLPLSCDFLVFM